MTESNSDRTSEATRIMIVEDEAIFALVLQSRVTSLGHTVAAIVTSAEDALKKAEAEPPDLVLMDIKLAGEMDGIEAAEIMGSTLDIPVVFLTSFADESKLTRAKLASPFGYLLKPVEDRELRVTIEMALYRADVDRKNRRIEGKLRESELRFRALIEHSYDSVALVEPNGAFLYNSPSIEGILGYKPDEIIGQIAFELIHPDDVQTAIEKFEAVVNKPGHSEIIVYRARHKNGGWVWLEGLGSNMLHVPGVEAIVVNSRDITDRKHAEEQLAVSLREKEILLREIHHRVKNNLQVVISLLRLQARRISDPVARAGFADSQKRIQAMALIHETLYASDDLSEISCSTYFGKMVDGLAQSHRGTPAKMMTDVGETSLHIDQAVPVGLIVNELVCNAMDHGFPDGSPGEIRITLQPVTDSHVELVVSDNGIGLAEEIEPQRADSLGLRLVSRLVEHQLGGTIDVFRDNGTRFVIIFKRQITERVGDSCLKPESPGGT